MKRGFRHWSNTRKRVGERRGRPVLLGLAAAVILLALMITGIACLIGNGTLPVERAGMIGKGCFALASFLGCLLAAKRASKRKLVWAVIVGILFLLLSCGTNLLINGAEGCRLWIPAASCLLSVFIAVLLSNRTKGYGYR